VLCSNLAPLLYLLTHLLRDFFFDRSSRSLFSPLGFGLRATIRQMLDYAPLFSDRALFTPLSEPLAFDGFDWSGTSIDFDHGLTINSERSEDGVRVYASLGPDGQHLYSNYCCLAQQRHAKIGAHAAHFPHHLEMKWPTMSIRIFTLNAFLSQLQADSRQKSAYCVRLGRWLMRKELANMKTQYSLPRTPKQTGRKQRKRKRNLISSPKLTGGIQ
jgi:hypothetical protein